MTTNAAVLTEPLTYELGAPTSYFRDLALAENGDPASRARLSAHKRELKVELERREARSRMRAAQNGLELRSNGLETRVNPNRIQGQGGYFAPPLWLIEDFAPAPRPGRVLAALIPHFPLPAGVGQVSLPAETTGTVAGPDSDGGTVPSTNVLDGAITSPAMPFAGNSDWSLQALEQSPPGPHLDWAMFKDLTASYDAQLEQALIVGTGTGGQFTGILNLPTGAGAVSKVVYNDGAPTGSKIFTQLGLVAAQLGDARLLPPEAWLMRTARWAYLGTAEDSSGQPLAVPGHNPSPPVPHLLDDDTPTPVASELGWPIYPDDAIPATLGATANQDTIIACRPSDSMLLESEPHVSVMLDVLSGTLQARLQLHAYAAVLYRYPTGFATLTGSGMVLPASY